MLYLNSISKFSIGIGNLIVAVGAQVLEIIGIHNSVNLGLFDVCVSFGRRAHKMKDLDTTNKPIKCLCR